MMLLLLLLLLLADASAHGGKAYEQRWPTEYLIQLLHAGLSLEQNIFRLEHWIQLLGVLFLCRFGFVAEVEDVLDVVVVEHRFVCTMFAGEGQVCLCDY